MNKQIKKLAFISLTIASVLAFKTGDQIELTAFLNARSSAKFHSTSNNVTTQLQRGTKGEVVESKKMNSGNFGIKMLISTGPHAGKNYWLYYNVSAPKMKLFDNKMTERKVAEIAQAKTAKLTEDQPGIRDPEESAVIAAASMATGILSEKNSPEIALPSGGANCAPAVSLVSSNVSEEKYTESDVVEPFREVATSPLHSKSCQDQTSGWLLCKSSEDKKIEAFGFTNKGPNKIVKSPETYINREWSFEFDDRARSDIKLLVADAPDDTTSHITYSIMLFFPRSVLPAIKREGDELVVTLPNKEIVRYDAKTKEVIGGVFSEGVMATASNKKALPPSLKYTGNGVMIRSDKSGDLPYGDIETRDGGHAPSISQTTISKKGFKDCKVPSKEIWYTDYNKDANVFIKPEFANDKGLDDFIKKKCGFSLY